jgi:prepilin-type processing-associated H-X9-DG protein
MHHLTASGQPIKIVREKSNEEDAVSFTFSFADSMQAANGAINHQYAAATDAIDYPVGPRVTLEDFKDGMGNTALFSESLQAIPWHQLEPDPMVSIHMLQPVVPSEQVAYPKWSRFVQGMVWLYEDPEGAGGAPRTPAHRTQVINSSPDAQDIYSIKMNRDNAVELARPSSAHSEGCNFGFADGSSRFISETIDYRVYQALLTPRGKKSLVPDPSYVHRDEAL